MSPALTEGANALWYARAVLADIASQDTATVIEACRLVERQGTDPMERKDAHALRATLEGEAA
ncbi:hypothetical protein [Mameliella alba]|uniref:Uncharacterized protein n=1 Tax=Mameliella alba TaxID=561184 RepID=A0A0B3RT78_9RHOB|nr:hypothetical protein [Mameliella alba]KHQ51227.1 hypothetical protein OA50_04260 [Mameliella alba]OWV40412.1 hypothetical protein CDZ95_21530 [Mameliella alba]